MASPHQVRTGIERAARKVLRSCWRVYRTPAATGGCCVHGEPSSGCLYVTRLPDGESGYSSGVATCRDSPRSEATPGAPVRVPFLAARASARKPCRQRWLTRGVSFTTNIGTAPPCLPNSSPTSVTVRAVGRNLVSVWVRTRASRSARFRVSRSVASASRASGITGNARLAPLEWTGLSRRAPQPALRIITCGRPLVVSSLEVAASGARDESWPP